MKNSEFIQFTTSDRLTLPGLLFSAPNSKKAAIYLHGNGSNSIFYYDEYFLAEELLKKGISLLMFNNRGAHIIKNINVGKERKRFGMAYEKIKDCIPDIDGAIKFLEEKGYEEFYLIGVSTGANKICVYNFYKSKNKISKYVLICGGDDTGIYYDLLGKEKFYKLLKEAGEKIKKGEGEEIISELLPDEVFSYIGFYDIANPDGDYNIFPYFEVINNLILSSKPLFRHFKSIKKPSIIIYGDIDEYAWGNVKRIVNILKKYKPKLIYKIIKGADHRFKNHEKELAKEVSNYLSTSR